MGFSTLGLGAMFKFDSTSGYSGLMRAASGYQKLTDAAKWTGKEIDRTFLKMEKGQKGGGGGGGMLGGMGKWLLGGAVVTGAGMLAKAAWGAAAGFEDMNVELGTTFNVLAGGGMMKEGLSLAKDEMKEIQMMAIKAPGSADDLLQIYKQIAGPVITAGKGLKEIKELTFAGSIAAKGMGFDFKNMGFGLSKMIAGSSEAGDDLFKVFSKSLGLIKVTAAEWNQLSSEERFKQLQKALAKYGEAADTIGATWTATISTSLDLAAVAGRAFIDNMFQSGKTGAGFLNNWFIENGDAIQTKLGEWGQIVGDFFGDVVTFFTEAFTGFSRWIPDIQESLGVAWNAIMDSIGLIASTFGNMLDNGEGKAVGFGEFMGIVFSSIADIVKWLCQGIEIAVITVMSIPYAFQVAGQRIGETIGLIVGVITNAFKGIYNIMTEPFRKTIDFFLDMVNMFASTSFGSKMFEKLGLSQEDVKKLVGQGKSMTADAKYDSVDGYGDLPESPGARYLKEQDKKEKEAATKAAKQEVKVENHNHTTIENKMRLNVDGKQLAAAQAKQQLELTERAGAQTSAWQRRQLVTRSMPLGGKN